MGNKIILTGGISMETNGRYQYDLVKKLSFVRWGGTDEELCAAGILMDEIKKAGGKAEYMEFKIPAYELQKCSVSVVAHRPEVYVCRARR